MDIGERIVKLRKEKGLSQRGLARKAMLNNATIWKIEHGLSYPSETTIEKNHLGIGPK